MMMKNNNFYPRSPCGERHYNTLLKENTISNFYPRSPCGERHKTRDNIMIRPDISIHALLAESDCSPLRKKQKVPAISIHALLAESD